MSTTKALLVAPGTHVTCRTAVPAYGSRYGGRAVQDFRPGMVGVVYSYAPKVRLLRDGCRCPDFAVVDFRGDDGRERRCGLDPHNTVATEGRDERHGP